MNDDCPCKFCSARRLDDDPPGYVPAANARRQKMEPIPTQTIDWGELSAFGGGVTANASEEADHDADGLVTNERADGGIPTTTIDWEALSAFRPRK